MSRHSVYFGTRIGMLVLAVPIIAFLSLSCALYAAWGVLSTLLWIFVQNSHSFGMAMQSILYSATYFALTMAAFWAYRTLKVTLGRWLVRGAIVSRPFVRHAISL